jgi:hypothetical protein
MKKVFLSFLTVISLILVSCEKDCITPGNTMLPRETFKPDRDKLIALYEKQLLIQDKYIEGVREDMALLENSLLR